LPAPTRSRSASALDRDVLLLEGIAEFEDWVLVEPEDGGDGHARVVALVTES